MQWGGRVLYADGRFATAGGKARFARLGAVLPSSVSRDRLSLSTRRGKQFNSMVQRDVDPLTGASRDDILISAEDVRRLGLEEGTRVSLRSDAGVFAGTLRTAPIKPGNVQVHWPEGNVLLGAEVDPESIEPDYNTSVTIDRSS